MLSELELVQSELFPQCSNSPRPSWQGSGYELSRPGHSCLQDNKHSVYYETHTADPCGKRKLSPWRLIGDPRKRGRPGHLTDMLIGPRLSLPVTLIESTSPWTRLFPVPMRPGTRALAGKTLDPDLRCVVNLVHPASPLRAICASRTTRTIGCAGRPGRFRDRPRQVSCPSA